MILSWILVSLVLVVCTLGSVSGEGELESCRATAGRTSPEPNERTGTALAQIKMNSAKPSMALEELRSAAEPVGDPDDDAALGPEPQTATGIDRQQQKTQEELAKRLENETSEQLTEPEEEEELESEPARKLIQRKPHLEPIPPISRWGKPHKPEPKKQTKPPLKELPIPGMEEEEPPELELDELETAFYVVIPIASALLLSFFFGNLLEKFHLDFIPESAVTLCLGMCMGFYMKFCIAKRIDLFSYDEFFKETVSMLLTLFLLPILIFQSGWTLRKRDFASQFEYIMLYAVFGTLLSFTVVGLLILYTGNHGWHTINHPRTAFAYASLIAATDPVATLSTYASLKVDPLLNILVFGDSTFNDAVAIVLFKVLNSNAIMGGVFNRPSLGELSKRIACGITELFFCSAGIGILSACLFLLGLRLFEMRNSPSSSILALTTSAFVTFAAAEVFNMSGIIATVFNSFILGIYARHHLSDAGSLLADFWLNQFGCIMDHFVFLLTGFCVVVMGTKDGSGWIFGLWAMLFCLIGRAFSVFPISWMANCCKRRAGRLDGVPEQDWHLVSPGFMFMMWHASLRGAISLTLCMQLGAWVDDCDGPGTRKTLQSATFLLLCVFLAVFGGSTDFFLKKLRIPMGEDAPHDKLYNEVPGSLKSAVSKFDENFMFPLLVGKQSTYHRLNKSVDAEDVLSRVLRQGA